MLFRSKMKSQTMLYLLVVIAHVAVSRSEEDTQEQATRLTSKNFHDILSMDDPWIVVFTEELDKRRQSELIALTNSVVGIIRIGFVDMDDPESDELIEAKRISKSQIRVYGYGEENKEKPSRASTYNEAIEMALETYPDTVTRIEDENIPSFYSKAMKESKPRKLPIIYFSEKDEVLPALRYLALTLKDIFSFSILVNPSAELQKNFNIELLPQLTVFSHLNLKTGAFEMIKYDRQAFGPPNYLNLLKFLLGVQNEVGDKKHRKNLEKLMFGKVQGSTMDPARFGVQQLTSQTVDKICGPTSMGLCVIAFLTADDERDVKVKEDILDRVRKSDRLRERHIRYSWINATCHQNIADAFDVDITQLPYVVAVHRSKSMFVNHVGSFSLSDVRDFLFAVLSGRKKMISYEEFPAFVTKDCRLTTLKCEDGVCKEKNRGKGKSKRGPTLSGNRKSEL